jgi:hypothetical protein
LSVADHLAKLLALCGTQFDNVPARSAAGLHEARIAMIGIRLRLPLRLFCVLPILLSPARMNACR